MPASPIVGHPQLQLSPEWGATGTVEFPITATPVGNNYQIIQYPGLAAPIMTLDLTRKSRAPEIDSAIAILNQQGGLFINYRLFPEDEWILWSYDSYNVVTNNLGNAANDIKTITVALTNSADPAHNATLPAIASTTKPYTVLPSGFAQNWQTETSFDFIEVELKPGGVRSRAARSLFNTQARLNKINLTIEPDYLNAGKFTTIQNFLLARRGYIPFRISTSGADDSFIVPGNYYCPRWSYSAIAAATSTTRHYRFQLQLVQWFD
ncbi:MAG: hypothetical protein ACRC62_15250 [Microcoleus sp.]